MFDLTVHHRGKDGSVINKTPYQYVCDREKGNYFVRDGVKYFENGEVVPTQTPVAKEAPKEEKPIKKIG